MTLRRRPTIESPLLLASKPGHDTWFVWRNLLALWIALAYSAKVLLLRSESLANYAPPADIESSLDGYVLGRGVYAVVACCIYLFSYLRDWHFRTVAWVFVSVALAAFALDWVRVYVFVLPQPAHWVPGLIGLRIVALACLLGNAINAHRAPPMPRSLWR